MSTKKEVNISRRELKLLRKTAVFPNFNRIINNTIILELGIGLLSLTDKYLILTTFLMSSFISNISIKVILSMIMCLNTYAISVGGALLINKIYNKIRLKKFSSKEKQELLEEELLSKINLEKITVRKRLDDIAKEYKKIAKINISTYIDFSELDKLENELDYLITKKNLIESYLNYDDVNLFDQKIKKKLSLVPTIFSIISLVFIYNVISINFISSIFIYFLLYAIVETTISEVIMPQIVETAKARLKVATSNVETKLGEFYLPKDQEHLISELVDIRSKIVVKIHEISSYYYNLYVNKILESTNNETIFKSIEPIDRTYDPVSHHRTRIKKEDSK